MESYIEAIKEQIADITYTNFEQIVSQMQPKSVNFVQNHIAISYLFEVFGYIGKVKTDVPIYKMISAYANKYKSVKFLENHVEWCDEVNKIYKASVIRKKIDVDAIINDMIGLSQDEVQLAEEKQFATTIGVNENRTLRQRLADILSGKEEKAKRGSKKAATEGGDEVAPKKKRGSTKKAAAPADDILGELAGVMVGTNKTVKSQTPDLIGEEEEEEDEAPAPAPAPVPKKIVRKGKPSTTVNKSQVSQLSGRSRGNASILQESLHELEDF